MTIFVNVMDLVALGFLGIIVLFLIAAWSFIAIRNWIKDKNRYGWRHKHKFVFFNARGSGQKHDYKCECGKVVQK